MIARTLNYLALLVVSALVVSALALSVLVLASAPAGASDSNSWHAHNVDGPNIAAWSLADLGSLAPAAEIVITWAEVGRPGDMVIGAPPVPAAPCHEDMPCWDWRTMGNGCRGIRSEHGVLIMLECWNAETGQSYGRGY